MLLPPLGAIICDCGRAAIDTVAAALISPQSLHLIAGADALVRDGAGRLALEIATAKQFPQIAAMLREAGGTSGARGAGEGGGDVEVGGVGGGAAGEGQCDFDVIDASDLTEQLFFETYFEGHRPVLVKGYGRGWKSKEFLSAQALLDKYGDTMVDVSVIPYESNFYNAATRQRRGRASGAPLPRQVALREVLRVDSEVPEGADPTSNATAPQPQLDPKLYLFSDWFLRTVITPVERDRLYRDVLRLWYLETPPSHAHPYPYPYPTQAAAFSRCQPTTPQGVINNLARVYVRACLLTS